MDRRTTLPLTTIALLCVSAFDSARADETVKFRHVMHITPVQTQEIGDVDGHALSLVRQSGLASFPDGTVGTVYFTAVADYTKGAGPFSIYFNLTLKDGSTLWLKTDGTTRVDGTTSVFQGPVTVLGGNGRFEGAKGDGTFTGARIAPLAVGADQYAD